MAATPSSNPTPSGSEQPAVAVPITFEDKLNQFWQKNRAIVLGLCVFVLLAILGKGVWERMQRQKEVEIESKFAAATTPEQLKAFAAANPGHPLAGVAELRIADEAYAAGKAADAAAGYDRAIAALKKSPLAGRAILGRAIAKLQAGKAAEGVAELKQVAGDAAQLKSLRSEAAYHLASVAAEQGNAADVQKYVEQLNQIDPASLWARRAMMLQATLPKPATTPAASAAAPAPAKDGAPKVEINVPKK